MPNDEFGSETMTDRGRHQIEPSIEQIIETVSSWSQVTTDDGRFNSTTFQVADRDIGHVHSWGPVDIGYPQRLRKQLIAEDKTGEHHVVADRATTFHVEGAADVEQAVALLRLSYLYHVLILQKRDDVDSELAAIGVSDELASMGMSDDIRAIFEDIRSR